MKLNDETVSIELEEPSQETRIETLDCFVAVESGPQGMHLRILALYLSERREIGLCWHIETSTEPLLAFLESGVCEDDVGRGLVVCAIEWTDVSLRQSLGDPERPVDAIECLHIFTQIVDIVNLAHSQGGVVNNVWPSCFFMSSFHCVSFIESASCSSESGSDSMEDISKIQTAECKGLSSPLPHNSHQHRSHFDTEDTRLERNQTNASHLGSESSCLQSSSVYPMPKSLELGSNVKQAEEKKHSFPMKQILLMEKPIGTLVQKRLPVLQVLVLLMVIDWESSFFSLNLETLLVEETPRVEPKKPIAGKPMGRGRGRGRGHGGRGPDYVKLGVVLSV